MKKPVKANPAPTAGAVAMVRPTRTLKNGRGYLGRQEDGDEEACEELDEVVDTLEWLDTEEGAEELEEELTTLAEECLGGDIGACKEFWEITDWLEWVGGEEEDEGWGDEDDWGDWGDWGDDEEEDDWGDWGGEDDWGDEDDWGAGRLG